MATPNLMVESSAQDLGDMMAALSFHVGEVQRNPYHLLVPAWMQDNVRRGGELVGGQGGAAPDFPFATLYRLRRWARGGFEPAFEGGKILAGVANAGECLALRDPAGLAAASLFGFPVNRLEADPLGAAAGDVLRDLARVEAAVLDEPAARLIAAAHRSRDIHAWPRRLEGGLVV